MPTARWASGASTSSIRPVPVPRSSSARTGSVPTISRSAVSTRSSGTCRARILSQFGACAAKCRAARRGKEEGPATLAVADNEAGLRKQLQVPGNPRLRLAEDGDEFAHGQLGLRKKGQQPQPRLLAGRAEGTKNGIEGERRLLHRAFQSDIKISLYRMSARCKPRLFETGIIAYIHGCRLTTAMAINGHRNKPFAPGGGTRRLHQSPPSVGCGGGEIGSTRV